MSYADELFVKMCRDILDNGTDTKGEKVRPKWEDTNESAYTIKRFGVVNRYDLRKEFPALTLRKTALKSCMDEILWIYQKKSNNVNDLHSHIWDAWADENGSIGTCYGDVVGRKFIYSVTKEPGEERLILNGVLNQRSQDVLAANNWNVCQYAILLMMVAQVNDMIPGELVHVIADAHIYDRHVPVIEELIKREQYPAPKVSLNPEVKDFYKFTTNDLIVEDYQAGEQIKNIPIAV